MIASGLLLVIIGVSLLMQTLIGDLPGRILSWAPNGDIETTEPDLDIQEDYEPVPPRWT